ncbi:hypothetical protein HK096_002171 [Nowakowskiella sp. JEL0078]|nr:hypothetical protein HK096_002171 [Nowakowskiella sp. JEL0078]
MSISIDVDLSEDFPENHTNFNLQNNTSSASSSNMRSNSPVNASSRSPPNSHASLLNLIIRFSNGLPDLSLTISSSSTVSTLKSMIFSSPLHSAALSMKSLRLVHSGRLLRDSVKLETVIPINSATEIPDVKDKGKKSILSNETVSVFLHCVVADGPVSESQAPQITTPVGFERLLEVGLSADEVNDLRRQFHAVRGTTMDQSDAARTAEEEWFDNGGQTTANVDNPHNGGIFDMMWGLTVGFFSGIFSILWLKEAGIFNRRQQIGIFAGFIVNMSFGVLRLIVS